jgi:hypothetical protein
MYSSTPQMSSVIEQWALVRAVLLEPQDVPARNLPHTCRWVSASLICLPLLAGDLAALFGWWPATQITQWSFMQWGIGLCSAWLLIGTLGSMANAYAGYVALFLGCCVGGLLTLTLALTTPYACAFGVALALSLVVVAVLCGDAHPLAYHIAQGVTAGATLVMAGAIGAEAANRIPSPFWGATLGVWVFMLVCIGVALTTALLVMFIRRALDAQQANVWGRLVFVLLLGVHLALIGGLLWF